MPADEDAVLALVDDDRMGGQPASTPAMLDEALQGRSPVDAGWWAELEPPDVVVAEDADGVVVGAVSYALRLKDDTGQLLWLHCREDARTADVLIRHALAAFGTREVHAFSFASALSLGLEALPVLHRPATVEALRRAGFTGERLWRYMLAALPVEGMPRLPDVRVGHEPGDRQAWRLEAHRDRRVVAEAVVGSPVQGTGVLRWIGVLPDLRGRGLGRAMLGNALGVLTERGADTVVLYVDDDAAAGDERDRTAAISLYESVGFAEVDRLYSYSRPRGPGSGGLPAPEAS
ncbi:MULTISPECIES: GNAT family N-acetyltransferase [Streptomyces]|uniref:GNAT family N-acetyltransferase n=1 Tax=Streptomyces achmelvichensis TaxID=3134111 RepID=A0ACC6PPS3_9ACTN|nr:GNAT family N-acetyltransferase [Streptomyces sp. NBC_01167]